MVGLGGVFVGLFLPRGVAPTIGDGGKAFGRGLGAAHVVELAGHRPEQRGFNRLAAATTPTAVAEIGVLMPTRHSLGWIQNNFLTIHGLNWHKTHPNVAKTREQQAIGHGDWGKWRE